MAVLRLERVAELKAKGKLQMLELLTGMSLDFAGAAGTDASEIAQSHAHESITIRSVEEEIEEGLRALKSLLQQPDLSGPTFASKIGIDLEALPPQQHLTEETAALLCEELIPLMAAFGSSYAGPKEFPRLALYPFLLETLRSKRNISDVAIIGDDGCTGYPVGCQWGVYCHCMAYWRKQDFIEKGGDPSYPDERFWNKKRDPFDFRSAAQKGEEE